MIQRVQSLFLVMVAMCYTLLFFIPIGYLEDKTPFFIYDDYIISAIGLIIITFSFFSILKYDNLAIQKKLALLCCLLSIFFLIATHFKVYADPLDLSIEKIKTTLGVGVLFPVLSILFSYLAFKFIKKDESILKDMDRFR